MGTKLEKIYEVVMQQAGLEGRTRLATTTGVSKVQAAEMDDTEKVLTKFKNVASEIIGQDIDELL